VGSIRAIDMRRRAALMASAWLSAAAALLAGPAYATDFLVGSDAQALIPAIALPGARGRGRRRALLSGTMLAGAVLLTALVTGAAIPARADGGAGGAGGFGAANGASAATITNVAPLTGAGSASSNTSSISGGSGGNGANGAAGGGSGGDGGVGVQFTQTGVSLTNAGTIAGGNGGTRGLGGAANGNFGAGGAGIVGSGLTIINSGIVTGGLSGDGVTRANAITFTAGTNTLELRAGSSITGNVVAASTADTLALSLASEDRRLAATVEQWDANPWLLNTPDGVVDSHTGKLREHRPDDYMTKQTAASPAGACPMWKKFLKEVTGGDEELQKYLQRITGYFLTGETYEQELFFFYGSGGNGKGVWVQTISGIFKDYHHASSISAAMSVLCPWDWLCCASLFKSQPRRRN
jgi:hypothetical protein